MRSATRKRPFVAVLGGSKVSSKIDVIKSLLPRVDKLLIGGGMTYTFLKAQGLEVGKSIVENDKLDLARSLMAEAGDKLELGTDFVVTDKLDFKARSVGTLKTVAKDAIPANWEGVDVGPATVATFTHVLLGAKTIICNGPVGVFELDATANGTMAIAEALAKAIAGGATTIIGGGRLCFSSKRGGVQRKVSHVSTGRRGVAGISRGQGAAGRRRPHREVDATWPSGARFPSRSSAETAGRSCSCVTSCPRSVVSRSGARSRAGGDLFEAAWSSRAARRDRPGGGFFLRPGLSTERRLVSSATEEHPAGSKGLHLNFAFVADVPTRDLAACDEYTAVRWVGDPVPVECPLNVRQLVRLARAVPGDSTTGSTSA